MASGIAISGSVLRALRHDRLWSQAELASRSGAFARAEGERQCGITREAVSKLERGGRSPSPRTLRYLIGALRPTREELRRLLGQEPPRALASLTQDVCSRDSDAVHRRALLSSLVTVTAASPHDTLRRIARALGCPARVDGGVLDALLAQSGRLGVSALGLGPAPVIRAAMTHLHGIERLVEFPMADGERQRVGAVNADAAALVGWLSWLLDRRAEAAHAMSSATRLARESGDRVLQARVLGLLSWMASPIPTGGQRGDAATARSLAMHAAAAARGGPPADRAWLIERTACEHAAAGEADACRRALWEARQLGPPRPARHDSPAPGFFESFLALRPSHALDAAAGLCHVLLGESEEALATLTAIAGDADPSDLYDVGNLLCGLAAAHAQRGDVEAAARVAMQAVSLARRGGFPLNLLRVHGLRQGMPEWWEKDPAIRELDECLHEAS